VTEPNDHVPVSVRLGEVVPPEDPEDWTRPLTWVAALGMLAAPLATLAWFALAAPQTTEPVPATSVVAVALAGGAAATGATQQGRTRAFAATLAAALFGALATIALGVGMAGERQTDVASPTLAHAVAASIGGLAGALGAAALAPALAPRSSRLIRWAVAGGASALVAALVVAAFAG
jgi:hypothetical protein